VDGDKYKRIYKYTCALFMNVYSMDSLNICCLHYRPINITLLTVWIH